MNNYGYIYKTTNLLNNKVYVGQKKGKFDPDYFGSGVIIKQAIQKNGRVNFTVIIIKNAVTKEEADLLEKKYIADHRQALGRWNVYNIAGGGDGGYNGGNGFKGHTHTEEAKELNRQSHLGKKQTEEHREKNRLGHLGKNKGVKRGPHSKESNEKRRLSMLGKNIGKKSIETRMKMSQAHLGKKRDPHSFESKEKIRLSITKWWKDRKIEKI
jgi:hypothetical protein